jgi:ELWxxDGT repeat protein
MLRPRLAFLVLLVGAGGLQVTNVAPAPTFFETTLSQAVAVCPACTISDSGGGSYDPFADAFPSGQATVTLVNYVPGVDVLHGANLSISFLFDAASGALSLAWLPSTAMRNGGILQNALRSVMYSAVGPDPAVHGTLVSRRLSVSIDPTVASLLLSLTVAAVNNAPTVAITAPLNGLPYTAVEGAAAGVAPFPVGSVLLADEDDTHFTGATIACSSTSCVRAQDSLLLDSTGSCAAVTGAMGLTWTATGPSGALAGSATLDDYTAALACVRFTTAAAGAPSLVPRVLTLTVTDAGEGSTPPGTSRAPSNGAAVVSVNVSPVNDAPMVILAGVGVNGESLTPAQLSAFYWSGTQPGGAGAGTVALSTPGSSGAFVPEGVPIPVAPLLTLYDPDDAGLTAARVSITAYSCVKGMDMLALGLLDGVGGGMTQEVAEAFSRQHEPLKWEWDGPTCTLTLTGAASSAVYASLLRSVSFSVTDVLDPSLAARFVSFTVTDGGSNGQVLASRVSSVGPALASVGVAGTNLPPGLVKVPAFPPAALLDGAVAGDVVKFGAFTAPEPRRQLADVQRYLLMGATHAGPADSLGAGTGQDASSLLEIDGSTGQLSVAAGATIAGASVGWRIEVTVQCADRAVGDASVAVSTIVAPVFVVDAGRAPVLQTPAVSPLSDPAQPGGRLALMHSETGGISAANDFCVDLSSLVGVSVGATLLTGPAAALLLDFSLVWLAGADAEAGTGGASWAPSVWSTSTAIETSLADARLTSLFSASGPLTWSRPFPISRPGVHCLSGAPAYGPALDIGTTGALVSPRARVLHLRLVIAVQPAMRSTADGRAAMGGGTAAWYGATPPADPTILPGSGALRIDFDVDIRIRGCMDPRARYVPCMVAGAAVPWAGAGSGALEWRGPSVGRSQGPVCDNTCVDVTGDGTCDNACVAAGVVAYASAQSAGWAAVPGTGAGWGAAGEEARLTALAGPCMADGTATGTPANEYAAANPGGNFNPWATAPLSAVGSTGLGARTEGSRGLGTRFPPPPSSPSDGCVYPPASLTAQVSLPLSLSRLAAWRAWAAEGADPAGRPLVDWPSAEVYVGTAGAFASFRGVQPFVPPRGAGHAGVAASSFAAAALALVDPAATLAAMVPASDAALAAAQYGGADLAVGAAGMDVLLSSALGLATEDSSLFVWQAGIYTLSLPLSLSRVSLPGGAPAPPLAYGGGPESSLPPLLDVALLFAVSPGGTPMPLPYAPARVCVGTGLAPPLALLPEGMAGTKGWLPRLYVARAAADGAPSASTWRGALSSPPLSPLTPAPTAGLPPPLWDAARGRLCTFLPSLPAAVGVGWSRPGPSGDPTGSLLPLAPPSWRVVAPATITPPPAGAPAYMPEIAVYGGRLWLPGSATAAGTLPAFSRALVSLPLHEGTGTAVAGVPAVLLAPPSPTGWPLHLDDAFPRAWPTPHAGALYFASDGGPGIGRELWNVELGAEGREGGAHLVADLWPGSAGSDPAWLTPLSASLFLVASLPPVRDGWGEGAAWNTDSTAAGADPLPGAQGAETRPRLGAAASHDLGADASAPSGATADGVAGAATAAAVAARGPRRELWVLQAGAAAPVPLAVLTGTWGSAGPTGGTGMGARFGGYTDPTSLMPCGPASGFDAPAEDATARVYFSAASCTGLAGGAVDAGYELWATLPAPPHTPYRVTDVSPGPSSSRPGDLACWRGSLFFSAYTAANGREVWRHDTGTAVTSQLADGAAGASSFLQRGAAYFTPFASSLVFAAAGELHTLSHTLVLSRVADIYPGSPASHPAWLRVHAGRIYFACEVGAPAGRELCSWDGASPPRLAADMRAGTCDPAQAVADGAEGASGVGLADPSGCRAGGASSDPAGLAVFDGRLWLTASLGGAADRSLVAIGAPPLPTPPCAGQGRTPLGPALCGLRLARPPGEADAGDAFGAAVAVSPCGSLLAVGAPGAASGAGALFLYKLVKGVWQRVAGFGVGVVGGLPSPPSSPSALGSAVSFAGNASLVVGAPGTGTAYVLRLGAGAGGGWGVDGVLVPVPRTDETLGTRPRNGEFGAAVTAWDGGIAVGAPEWSDGVALDAITGAGEGGAWVFTRGLGGWTAGGGGTVIRLNPASLPPPNGQDDATPGSSSYYGAAIAGEAGVVVVGAPRAAGRQGRAYVWGAVGASWTLAPTAAGRSPSVLRCTVAGHASRGGVGGLLFASALSLSSRTLLLGAPGLDGDGGWATGADGSGAVYVAVLAAEGPSALPPTWVGERAGVATGLGGVGTALALAGGPTGTSGSLLLGAPRTGSSTYSASTLGVGGVGVMGAEGGRPLAGGSPEWADEPRDPALRLLTTLALPGGAGSGFGAAVAAGGAAIAIGAPGEDGGAGAVYVPLCVRSCPTAAGLFTASPCTAAADAVCGACEVGACPVGSWEAAPCREGAQRSCAPCAPDCPPGLTLVAPCSATSDTLCGTSAAAALAVPIAPRELETALYDALAGGAGRSLPSACVREGTCTHEQARSAGLPAAQPSPAVLPHPVHVRSSIRLEEGRTLRALGQALGWLGLGGMWRTAASAGRDPCRESWPGVTCDAQGHVIGLAVDGEGSVRPPGAGGALPSGPSSGPCLGLPHLRTLSLAAAGVSGPLSPSLCSCASLSLLDLSRNDLSGALPACLVCDVTLQGREEEGLPCAVAGVPVLPALVALKLAGNPTLPLGPFDSAWSADDVAGGGLAVLAAELQGGRGGRGPDFFDADSQRGLQAWNSRVLAWVRRRASVEQD